MPEIADFSKVAPYLHNPLILVGLITFLFFGILGAILKAGLLVPLSQRQSSTAFRLFLNYAFSFSITALVLTIGYGLYIHHETSHKQVPQVVQQDGDCSVNVNGDNNSGQTVNCDEKDKK